MDKRSITEYYQRVLQGYKDVVNSSDTQDNKKIQLTSKYLTVALEEIFEEAFHAVQRSDRVQGEK